MDQFRADLHIHSRYSRATSKSLTPRNLAAWAWVKGLDVLGTGDFTHPGWLAELKDQLTPDASGLYRLKEPSGLEAELPWLGGGAPNGRVRFLLTAEISSIYKRGGKVRKIHNLVFMPDFEGAERLNAKLAEVGNLTSDGRPILGLDSRFVVEMALAAHPLAMVVPAHIWTPWFSLFGSKSGFDSLEECYGEYAKEIFALETGLSSDPEMNRLLSALDRHRLISNSDAHSGEKLGREANLFSGEPSYMGIYRALRGEGLGQKFLGTIEFFPEEGKYHMDGHRKCGVVLDPDETRSRGGRCPVCGEPLTVGVLNRVLALADRKTPVQPAGQPGFVSLVPLAEVVSEILGSGQKTKGVLALYGRLIARFGSELTILRDTPLDDLARISPVLAEGLRRMRAGQVLRKPGYDGEFGVISLFTPKERKEFQSGGALLVPDSPPTTPSLQDFSRANTPARLRRVLSGEPALSDQDAETASAIPVASVIAGASEITGPPPQPSLSKPALDGLNDSQRRAATCHPGPVLVLAGPGTGKTRTLLARIEHLLGDGENARDILAVTFTRRAAKELNDRLLALLGESGALPRADTLHALAFDLWTRSQGEAPVLLSEEAGRRVFATANPDVPAARLKSAWTELALAREQLRPPSEDRSGTPDTPTGSGVRIQTIDEMFLNYTRLKSDWNLVDYTDLLEYWLEQSKADNFLRPYSHVLVDEIQDLTPLQLAVVESLLPPGGEGFFGIGDPRQSIYGFRGAGGDVRAGLHDRWPGLTSVRLEDNYRSDARILTLSGALFPNDPPLRPHAASAGEVHVFQAPSEAGEAAWISEKVRGLLGGTAHWQADAGPAETLAPGDIAVLVRIKALIPPILRSLRLLGLPCAAPEAEAFWQEPRVALILQAAARFLGIAEAPDSEGLACPDKVLARGPIGLAAYLQDLPPFDRLFWQSPAYRQLKEAYAAHDGWAGLTSWINLQSELELVRQRAEKVQVMTLHASKGLEFAAVFLPALEDGLVPFQGLDPLLVGRAESFDDAEERRLFYVGLTRAKSRLYLSHASHRELYGHGLALPVSPYLAELPDLGLKKSALVARKVKKTSQLSLI